MSIASNDGVHMLDEPEDATELIVLEPTTGKQWLLGPILVDFKLGALGACQHWSSATMPLQKPLSCASHSRHATTAMMERSDIFLLQMLLLLFTASSSTSDGDGACPSSWSRERPFNTDSAAQEEAPAASLLTWPTWSLTDNNRRMAHRGTFPFPSVGCLQKHLPPLQSLGHDKAMPALTVLMTRMLLLLFTASPSTSDGDGACLSSWSRERPFNTDSAAQEEAPAASLLTWPTWSLTDNNRRMAHRGTFPFPSVGCLQKHLPPLQSMGHDKATPALTVFMTGDRASALLFQARTGCLLTQSRRCELYRDDPTCHLCGKEEETIDHVFSRRKRLEHTGKNASSCTLEPALGLAGADDDVARRETEDTECRLVEWERLCRNMETLNGRGL
ncbi:hypothetical protein ISCGN_026075 [Ixodes scapularis]